MSNKNNGKKNLSEVEFVQGCILAGRNGKSKGIHTVFSGFNGAYRKHFTGKDPIEAVNRLSHEGKIYSRPSKRGAMIYLPTEKPESRDAEERANALLAKVMS